MFRIPKVLGYDGPIYMTLPTRAVSAALLDDYQRHMVERKGVDDMYSADDVKACLRKAMCSAPSSCTPSATASQSCTPAISMQLLIDISVPRA
mmetsp:Transcript_53743/g.123636  ORF Transcript_53743/g.123636 Transcript_53743/m.123636 type:complete len:93 (-) Transcript_53743:214-492(-)